MRKSLGETVKPFILANAGDMTRPEMALKLGVGLTTVVKYCKELTLEGYNVKEAKRGCKRTNKQPPQTKKESLYSQYMSRRDLRHVLRCKKLLSGWLAW